MIRVLVDACLLVKGTVSNVLFDLNQLGVISLHWSPEIGAQFVKNWAGRRVEAEIKDRLKRRLAPMTDEEELAFRQSS